MFKKLSQRAEIQQQTGGGGNSAYFVRNYEEEEDEGMEGFTLCSDKMSYGGDICILVYINHIQQRSHLPVLHVESIHSQSVFPVNTQQPPAPSSSSIPTRVRDRGRV